MKRQYVQIFFSFLLFIIVLILFIWGIYLSTDLDPAITATIITAASTLLASIIALATGRYLEKKKELESLHRDQKIPIYEKFLTGLLMCFSNNKDLDFDLNKFINDWHQKIIVWGGPDVVNEYINWKIQLTTQRANVKTIDSTEKLILAIRKELGHDDHDLKKNIFIYFILKDPQIYFEYLAINPDISFNDYVQKFKKSESMQNDKQNQV